MKFVLSFNCDNAAFETHFGLIDETTRILNSVCQKIKFGDIARGNLFDINGNKVSSFEFQAELADFPLPYIHEIHEANQ